MCNCCTIAIVWLFAQNHNGFTAPENFKQILMKILPPIRRITNDARECEMEENMGQVNTMIGNVFRADAANWYAKLKFFFFFFCLFVCLFHPPIWFGLKRRWLALFCACVREKKKEAADFVSFMFAFYSMFFFFELLVLLHWLMSQFSWLSNDFCFPFGIRLRFFSLLSYR